MSWKRELRERQRAGTPDARPRDWIRGELERRGVVADFAESLASRLEPQLVEQQPDLVAAVLDAVGSAYALESRTTAELGRNVRELQELERLMGNFAGELAKLDEALEVLAAYVGRMRTHTARNDDPERILH